MVCVCSVEATRRRLDGPSRLAARRISSGHCRPLRALPAARADFIIAAYGTSATCDCTLDGITQSKNLVRQVVAAPGTVCQ